MRLKKGLALFIALICVVAALGACSPSTTPSTAPSTAPSAAANAEWTVAIMGADKAEFTSTDYDKLTKVTVDVVQKKKDGSEQQQKWEGVLLKDVLTSLGVTSYTSITLAASDDYKQDYTPEIANDPKTILGTIMNGAALGKDGGFVEAIAGSQAAKMWVKNLVTITVNK